MYSPSFWGLLPLREDSFAFDSRPWGEAFNFFLCSRAGSDIQHRTQHNVRACWAQLVAQQLEQPHAKSLWSGLEGGRGFAPT
eukprot:4262136-Amphidinium_carterae.1